MMQTALNDRMQLPRDTWVLVSEINCTFTVEQGDNVQFIGMDGAAPAADQTGITYARGTGQDATFDMLGRFVGAGTADRLYAISRHANGSIFVSRAAVA
jgi:hypothetical protein